MLTGAAACCLGLALGSRQAAQLARPDPWRLAEWLVVGLGLVPATVFTVLAATKRVGRTAGTAGLASLPAVPRPRC